MLPSTPLPAVYGRDSLLLGVGCNSISAIVSEQFDVERSVAVVHVAKASECEPLSVGVFSAVTISSFFC